MSSPDSISLNINSQTGIEGFRDQIQRLLPDTQPALILVKPNWVKHQENENFPISALVTSSALIESVVDACLDKYSTVKEIVIGDAPIQSCDRDLLKQQAGLERLIEKYQRYASPRVSFLDFRKERFRVSDGYMAHQVSKMGDPQGYREVILDSSSFLDEISVEQNNFRVSDYSPEKTASSHRRGFHRYLISGTALQSDLIINMPKMKTHQEAGITGALKNLVGINGEKAHLVHYRQGRVEQGGDEFPPGTHWLVPVQSRLREIFQKRSRVLFQLLRRGWIVSKRLYKIETEGTQQGLRGKFYIAAGSWGGNDTIWRMVYDINRIVRYAPSDGGRLSESPQRQIFHILDGFIAGEGNGPLQPLPVPAGVWMAGSNPFLMDMASAQWMGFEWGSVPVLAHFQEFGDPTWSGFDPQSVPIMLDGKKINGIQSLPTPRRFIPPPGWRDHLQYADPEWEG